MNLKGKTILITGPTSGIGRETAWALARMDAHIVMACRSEEKGKDTRSMIVEETRNKDIDIMLVDVSSMQSVRQFAEAFLKKYKKLHVLINNAGAFFMKREVTPEGFEKTFATNHLGPFLLTNLLLPLITRTHEARIINLASDSHYYGKLNLEDLQMKKHYGGFRAYAASRLATVFFTQELSQRLEGKGVTVNSVHPGHAATNIWPETKGLMKLGLKIANRNAISAEAGSLTSIYLASSEKVAGITGKYFDKKEIKEPSKKCGDMELQKTLWKKSEELVGL
jgi:NAD(P)-dependent dehydrogenase (short-subunit alcohol dehydrogenase family)